MIDSSTPYRLRTGPLRLLLVVTTLLLFGASAQAKSKVELEIAPGAAIPIGTYLVTDAGGVDQSIKNTAGFGLGVHLLLDDWELRYALSVLPSPTVSVRLTADAVDTWNDVIDELSLTDGGITPNTADGGFESEGSGDPIQLHHINFGYRFRFLEGPFRLYIPLGVGLSITSGPSELLSRALYGLSANTGLGFSYEAASWFEIGSSLRYLFTFSEANTNLAVVTLLAQSGLGRRLLDEAYAVSHLLHFTASATFKF